MIPLVVLELRYQEASSYIQEPLLWQEPTGVLSRGVFRENIKRFIVHPYAEIDQLSSQPTGAMPILLERDELGTGFSSGLQALCKLSNAAIDSIEFA